MSDESAHLVKAKSGHEYCVSRYQHLNVEGLIFQMVKEYTHLGMGLRKKMMMMSFEFITIYLSSSSHYT